MTKHAYEYGKRWNVKTPRASITFIVNKYHVSQSDQTVTDEIARRVAEARARDPNGWTDAIARESLRYALIVHHRNQDLCRRVMCG